MGMSTGKRSPETSGRRGPGLGSRKVAVTIDGPAGSGKSTTARLAAERLGYRCIDSGALYRAVAWKALAEGVDPENSAGLGALARRVEIRFEVEGGALQVWVDDQDVTEGIRKPEVTVAASAIARDPVVRQAMTEVQRALAAAAGVVLEGRDGGTVVLPHAEVKVFLAASGSVRAQRRQRELAGSGIDLPVEEVERDLAARDAQDSTRTHSPLRRPDGALEIDTTDLTIDEQTEAVVRAVRRAERGQPVSRAKVLGGIRHMRPHYGFFWRLLNLVGILVTGFRVIDRQNVPFPEGCIIACNHVSYWDPPIVGMAIPRELHFLAKRELFSNRLFGWLISAFNAVPINREGVDRRALERAQKLLRSGGALLVFPEGTRQKRGRLGRALAGIGALSLTTGVPILPAYVSGTRGFWRNLLERGRLCVRFGEPLAPESAAGATRSQRARELSDRVMREIAALEREGSGRG